MGSRNIGGYALGIALAVVMLGGCGGSQTGASGALPQGVTAKAKATHRVSWMKPGASGGDLLYVSSPKTNDVYVFTYPAGQPAGTLTGLSYPTGLCSDANGNVWIINAGSFSGSSNSSLVEYAHGGTTPIATLYDSNEYPQACSVDATSGNLAVGDGASNVAIYQDARGNPTYYSTAELLSDVRTITYDDSGNLYFSSFRNRPAWLPSGGSEVMKFGWKPKPGNNHASIQWDGQYLAVLAAKKGREEVYRYQVSGSEARNPSIVQLNGVCCILGDFWIQGSGLVLADGANVYFFNYPAGGNPTYTISGLDDTYGVTVSVEPNK